MIWVDCEAVTQARDEKQNAVSWVVGARKAGAILKIDGRVWDEMRRTRRKTLYTIGRILIKRDKMFEEDMDFAKIIT